MNRQNVTLSLPRSLLRKAKLIATKNDTSLSELLRESLEERVNKATGYQGAKTRQMKLIKEGFDMGIKENLTISREDIHGRR